MNVTITTTTAKTRPVGELVNAVGGGTPSKQNPAFWNGRIPWVSPKDMKVFDLHDAQDHVSEEAIKESAANLVQPGAVLIVVRGMILARSFPVAINRVPVVFNQDMKALVPKPELDAEYLARFLQAMERSILGERDTVTHGTLKLDTDDVLSLDIPLPATKAEQREIAKRLAGQMAQVAMVRAAAERQIKASDALRMALLRRAFGITNEDT
jgi:type I restriction enzyme S subunit